MNKKFIILTAAIVIILAASAYFVWQGGGFDFTAPENGKLPTRTQTTEKNVPPKASEITVIGKEFSFSPDSFTVKGGERVRIKFINEGFLSHNFVIPELGVQTKTIAKGQQDTVEFIAPRDTQVLSAICSVPGHKEAGMTATITVE